MMFNTWRNRLILIYIMFVACIVVLFIGKAKVQDNSTIASNIGSQPAPWSPARVQIQSSKIQAAEPKPLTTPLSVPLTTPAIKPASIPVPKTQIKAQPKQARKPQKLPVSSFKTTVNFKRYNPKYAVALANSSNYGERYTKDSNGTPVQNPPIIVLHETASTASSAINTFRNYNNADKNQVSYHALITLDGMIIYIVPPDKRAFGAGNSVFESPYGVETVKTNPNLPPSVNNFAYHVSLETPPDGIGNYNQRSHSGYTNVQYKSLAWLIAQSQVPDGRITTHRAVDRSGNRIDPRNFNFDKFFNLLHSYRQPLR